MPAAPELSGAGRPPRGREQRAAAGASPSPRRSRDPSPPPSRWRPAAETESPERTSAGGESAWPAAPAATGGKCADCEDRSALGRCLGMQRAGASSGVGPTWPVLAGPRILAYGSPPSILLQVPWLTISPPARLQLQFSWNWRVLTVDRLWFDRPPSPSVLSLPDGESAVQGARARRWRGPPFAGPRGFSFSPAIRSPDPTAE